MKITDAGRLRRARKRKGYTQYDLAALARCTQAAISAIETGTMTTCSKDLAETLLKWLELDVEDAFEERDGGRIGRVTNAAGSTRKPVAA